MNIAFIGLGNMGAPMALNLHKAGHSVVGFDLTPAACKPLGDAGARIAASAIDAVRGADVVISMLPASQHVDALYCGDGDGAGLLAALPAGTLVIDCSTIAAATSRKVTAQAAKKAIACIDAPVSGGTGGAIAGTLTFMVGGEAAALERARPLLEKMGQNIFHAGSIMLGGSIIKNDAINSIHRFFFACADIPQPEKRGGVGNHFRDCRFLRHFA